ncbi:MAG: glycosyltransferase [Coriobacteriia bacterium]|nr:glycosyltransferase [Coriobacteriia bacterium]
MSNASNPVYNTRMRIGLFVDMYLPHMSGITNHVRLYKRYFEQQGHEVFLVTFGSVHYHDDESNVIRNPAIPYGKTGWNYSPFFNRMTRNLIPTLDIAHVHHPFQSGSYLLNRVKSSRTPLVFTNHTRHDLYADVYARAIPASQRHKWNASYLRYFMEKCNLVIAPSASIADWLTTYVQYAGAQVIPNGIDLAPFAQATPKKPDSAARNALGIGADDILFCYVGRVSREKNINYLLQEFAGLARRHLSTKLLIIGSGTEMRYARNFIKEQGLDERIILAGTQDYSDIPSYIALADAFITGSVSEVHPLVVIEALAAGLPVVAVASSGISDTVEHECSGLLADKPELGALLTQAERLVLDESMLSRLSVGAKQRAQCYSLDNTARQVLEAYQKILDKR